MRRFSLPGLMQPPLTLVTIRRQSTGEWLMTCAVCGKLGLFRGYWPTARLARQHEEIHDDADVA